MKNEILEILSGRKLGDANDRWNDRCAERLFRFYNTLSGAEKERFQVALNELVSESHEPFSHLLDAARLINIDISDGVKKAAKGALRLGFSESTDRILADCLFHLHETSLPSVARELVSRSQGYPRALDVAQRMGL